MKTTRRQLLLAAAATATALSAKPKLDRSRLSVMSDEVGRNLEEAIAFAKQYNLQWVELRAESGANYYDRMPVAKLKEVAAKLKDNGLQCSFLNCALLKFTLPGTKAVSSEDFYENMYKSLGWTPESMWKNRMSDLQRCLDAANALGTKHLRSFTFWRVENPKSVFPQLQEAFHQMAEVAAKAGCRVLVENEFACNMASSDETADLLSRVKHKGLGLNWDPQNSTPYDTEGVFPAGFAKLPAKRIYNVQMKAEGLLGPDKKLDWAGIVAALDKSGYAGPFGLETHTLKGPAINIPASHECLKAMLRLMGEA